ncbi:hypothetical protein MP638_005456 [Amoeboaphelidium occidentale]|nr:hypothetical protein MP638_005456 [Amoeboaphelidium occidentale]
MADNNIYFAIVGPHDNPLYELQTTQATINQQQQLQAPSLTVSTGIDSADQYQTGGDYRHLNQFIVHASLDVMDSLQFSTAAGNSCYLRVIDKFNEFNISGYVTLSGVRFMLLHEFGPDDSVKSFFQECHELYIKLLMNPFYDCSVEAFRHNPVFDNRVKGLVKKYFY